MRRAGAPRCTLPAESGLPPAGPWSVGLVRCGSAAAVSLRVRPAGAPPGSLGGNPETRLAGVLHPLPSWAQADLLRDLRPSTGLWL